MNYVNFNNFQPLNETVYTREEAKTAILMVETKNTAKANILVANLAEEGNDIKSILSLVENKLDMVSALKSAKELLERNAFLGALAKAREAKAKTFEFNGKEYEVFGADVSEEEVVEEKFKYTEDQVNMVYGFYGSLESVYKEAQVQKMFTDAVADLMKAFKISEEVALLVLNAPIGRHTADMLYSKFAATASEGILKYFGGSEAKAKNFINQMYRANEAMNPNTELNEADEKELLTKAKEFKAELMKLKKSGGSEAAIAAKQEQLKRTAKALMIARANAYEGLEFEEVSEKEYSEDERKVMADKGEALPDGSFPIADKADLENAIHAYGRAGNQSAAAKHIAKRAKSLGLEDLIPTSDDFQKSLKESVNEANNYGAPAGLSKAETKKVAETLAKAISKNDGVKCTVNVKTLEEDSFDLDIDGQEFDGGSYNLYDDGSVRNMAVHGEKYGTTTSTVEDFIKGLKKPVKESVLEAKLNEAVAQEVHRMVNKFITNMADKYDYSLQDAVYAIMDVLRSQKYKGLNESEVNEGTTISVPKLSDIDHTRIIKWMTNQFDSNTWDMKKSGKGFEIAIDKLSKAEQEDLMAYLKSQDYITEANDHEVGMANGQLLDIAKNASELMKKIGETEKDLPGWIQDHISQAQNFLNQANTSYHELEESTELEEAKKYDLGFGSLGNGTTVWNRAQQVNGDYKTVAHISTGGNITYYDKKMPEDVKKQIEDMAANESTITEKVDMAELENTLKRVKKENPGKKVGYIFVQDAPKGYKISIDGKYTNESTITEGSISDIHIMAQEAKDFKSFIKAFTKEHHDLSNAGEPGQFEAWLKSIYDDAKESMDESVVNEGDMTKDYDGFVVLDREVNKNYKFKYIKGTNNKKVEDEAIAKLQKQTGAGRHVFMVNGLIKKGEWDKSEFEVLESSITEAKDVKSEVITKLSQFFDVSASALSKFKFDGTDPLKDLTKALNGTDYEGVDNIVRVAILAAKRDLGIDESLEINEKNEVTVSLRYAVQANDIFDDMYRKLGQKESTDVFSFKSKEYAEDFIESLIMVGVPKNEID